MVLSYSCGFGLEYLAASRVLHVKSSPNTHEVGDLEQPTERRVPFWGAAMSIPWTNPASESPSWIGRAPGIDSVSLRIGVGVLR
jgi:hypothetical protein